MIVFLSYSRADSQTALLLHEKLVADRVSIWIDQLDIPAGTPWDSGVQSALRECTHFVVLLSKSSVSSVNVLDEIAYALDSGKVVIPILVDDCERPFRLARLQYIELRGDFVNACRLIQQRLSQDKAQGGSVDKPPLPPKSPPERSLPNNRAKAPGLRASGRFLVLTSSFVLGALAIFAYFYLPRETPTKAVAVVPTPASAPLPAASHPPPVTIAATASRPVLPVAPRKTAPALQQPTVAGKSPETPPLTRAQQARLPAVQPPPPEQTRIEPPKPLAAPKMPVLPVLPVLRLGMRQEEVSSAIGQPLEWVSKVSPTQHYAAEFTTSFAGLPFEVSLTSKDGKLTRLSATTSSTSLQNSWKNFSSGDTTANKPVGNEEKTLADCQRIPDKVSSALSTTLNPPAAGYKEGTESAERQAHANSGETLSIDEATVRIREGIFSGSGEYVPVGFRFANQRLVYTADKYTGSRIFLQRSFRKIECWVTLTAPPN